MSINIEKVIKENSLEYANYVIKNRAICDVRDGMKPVHRRILYTMHLMKAYGFTKSQNISGQVTRLHPHGDTYGTMVTMVQKDGNLTPYIEGKGNFSQHTSRDLQAGASRYTEARLSEMAKDIFKDLDKKTVNFVPNFDGAIMMPEVLPVKFPAVLHYAQEGIAYSMSSRIPSFNLNELSEAIIKYIQTGEKTILVPDFATGAYIVENPTMFEKINMEGLGSVRLRAKAEINKNIISVTEIPYSTTREAIVDKIIDLIKSGKIKDITDVKDLTGLHGMEIEITCKKSADMEMLLEQLYQNTPMESSYSCNMNVISTNGLPQVLGVWGIIDEWLEWRRGCIKIGLSNEILVLNKKLHLLKGLEKVLLDIDKAIEIIRLSPESQINSNLIAYFGLDTTQAEYISNMKLRNINKDYIVKQIKDIHDLEKTRDDLQLKMSDEKAINEIVCNDLREVSSKYGKVRRTKPLQINEKAKETISRAKKEAPDYKVRLVVTKDGYAKKLSTASRAEQKLKEGDEIVAEFETNNRNELVVFHGTDAYKVKIDSLSDSKPTSLGDYLPSILGIDKVLGYTIVDDNYKYTLIQYSNGKIAKISNESYYTETSRKKLANSLCKGLDVIKVIAIEDDVDLLLSNTKGKTTEKNTAELQAKKSRATQGVVVIRNLAEMKLL
ncbi:MAG TPA: DNA topoisomerase [Lachnospiraceae bacterium]|nr:DNA gyrase subunit A [uncultured Lachnoclostridium sp.]HAU85127.1 DNA topoisomerase [Lachnospiraceae bacterium]